MKKVQKFLFSSVVFAFLFSFSSGLAFAQSTDTGVVTASKLNLRSGPGITYKIVGTLDRGKQVSILGNSGDWYRVKTSGGQTVWVSKENVSLKAVPKSTAQSAKKVSAAKDVKILATAKASRGDASPVREISSSSLSQELVDFSKNLLGVKYVWGGTTTNGFDCSGFVKYVYSKFGLSLKRVAADQAKEGTYIEKENLKPGDLVFFDTDGGHNFINHVGMYIGDGKFIQASSGHGDVVISDIMEGFYSKAYMTAKRFF